MFAAGERPLARRTQHADVYLGAAYSHLHRVDAAAGFGWATLALDPSHVKASNNRVSPLLVVRACKRETCDVTGLKEFALTVPIGRRISHDSTHGHGRVFAKRRPPQATTSEFLIAVAVRKVPSLEVAVVERRDSSECPFYFRRRGSMIRCK